MPVVAEVIKADRRRLDELLPDQAAGMGAVTVSNIAYDSRRVSPGDLFVACPGEHVDGIDYVPEAVRRGAVAIVAERPIDLEIPVIVVANARRAMAEMSHRFYGHPDRMIALVGVVGTNGKSTIAAGLQTIWLNAGINSGLMGTVMNSWGEREAKAMRTTPEAPDLDRCLGMMRDDGVTHAALEVSSHALALDRVWDLHFAGGIFTNLTRDHLDFHQTFEVYQSVKRSFFDRLTSAEQFAVINADDPACDDFARASSPARVIRYAVDRDDVDFCVRIDRHDLDGTCGRLVTADAETSFESPLWGTFNHSNLAAMAAAAFATGLSAEDIAQGIGTFHGVPGRLEVIPSTAPFTVCIDFAHTPDALRSVLSGVRPLIGGRLLVLFGCGGDRDKGKRPLMARAVEECADQVYLTSDNPRSEDPNAIIKDVQQGFRSEQSVWSHVDRALAITRVIKDAEPGDLVLLCGKGHEETQEIAGVAHPFSDREHAVHVLAADGHLPQTP